MLKTHYYDQRRNLFRTCYWSLYTFLIGDYEPRIMLETHLSSGIIKIQNVYININFKFFI